MAKLTYLKDKSRFLTKKDGSIIFTGKKMRVLIPRTYEDSKFFKVDDLVSTLGIMRCEINDSHYFNLVMLTMIDMDPSEISSISIGDEKFYELSFYSGDRFITNTIIIKSADVLFQIYTFFIALGKIPNFIEYADVHKLFDDTVKFCGVNLKTNKVIFEMIFSHLYRDSDNLRKPYRLTPKKKKPKVVGINTIAVGPESNLAKISGNYFNEGLMASLVNDPDKIMEIENLFRG